MPNLENETQIVTVAGVEREEDERQDAKLHGGEFDCEIREVKGEDRVLRFIGTTAIRDRMGDEIPLEGWDFKRYRKNPVVMLNHQYAGAPVGKTRRITKETINGVEGWVFEVEFLSEKANPEAERTLQTLRELGFGAVSVGFQSKKSERIGETEEEQEERKRNEPDRYPGWRFLKKELLELSIAWIPANPEALMVGRQKALATMAHCEALAQSIRERLDREIAMDLDQARVDVTDREAFDKFLKDNKEAIATTLRIKDELGDVVTKPGWDDKDEYTEIHYQVRPPEKFQDESFKRVPIKKEKPRVVAVMGRLKGETSLAMQSLRFPKEDDWTLAKAKAWLKDHPDVVKWVFLPDCGFWVQTVKEICNHVGEGLDASGPAEPTVTNTGSADLAWSSDAAVTKRADEPEARSKSSLFNVLKLKTRVIRIQRRQTL